MRAKNNVNRKYDIAKLAILVACFIFIFAATFIVSATANMSAIDIADAATKVTAEHIDDKNGGKVGSAGLTYGNKGKALDALDFNFPGTPNADGKWTYTESLSNIVASTSNFEASRSGGSDAPLWMEVEGTAGEFKTGSDSVGADRTSYSVINYNMGSQDSFLVNIMNNTMYQLDAYVSATLYGYCGGTGQAKVQVQLGLCSTASTVAALETGNYISKWSSQTITGNDNTVKNGSADFTLTNLKGAVLTIGTKGAYDYRGSRRDYWMSTANISITFTISKANTNYNASTVKEDGGNPIVATTLPGLATNNAATQAPYADKIVTNGNKVQYGTQTYDADLASELSKRLDSITDGSGTMQSYTNKALGTVTVGGQAVTYYKKLSVEYVDTYNYQTQDSLMALILTLGDDKAPLTQAQMSVVAGAGDKFISGISKNPTTGALSSITWGAGNVDYASGFKTVKVGDTEVNVFDIANGATSAPVKIIVDDGNDSTADDSVGVVEVKRTNISRIVVTIYMYRNAKVNTIVRDYGSGTCATSVNFAGIDNVLPTADLSFVPDEGNSIFFTNASEQNSKLWVRTNNLTFNIESGIGADEADDEFYSPYVWYYTVSKNNSSSSAINTGNVYGTYDQLNQNLRPIAVNEFDMFVYNFETGTAEGITKGSNISSNVGPISATGCGYYYFTFYVCDLAGNLNTARTESFYVKVDYKTPESTTTLVTDKPFNITKDLNGKWADCGETLSIDLISRNISGNTLLFDDAVTTHVLVLDGDKIVSLDGQAINDSFATVHIIGIDSEKDIAITTQSNGGNGTLIQFRVESCEYFAWEPYFAMYAGMNYLEGDNPTANIEAVTFEAVEFNEGIQGINFGTCVKVYVDNSRPTLPTISDADGMDYLKAVASKDALTTEIGSERTWFTKSDLMMDTVCEFNDIITDKTFASDLKMYYGVKTITGASDIDKIKSFIDAYLSKTISFDTEAYKDYFDRTAFKTGDALDGGESDLRIDFIQKDGTNMRVLLIWVVDEAGNLSENVQIYYVLADPSKYTVKSQILPNAVLGATASILQTNTDETEVTSFVRGERVVITLTLEEGYVPYKLVKKTATNSVLLTNSTSDFGWTVPATLDGFVTTTVSGNSVIVEYALDEINNLGALDKLTTLEFSHRKVVSYTITNNSVRYTAKPVVVPISYSDERTEGIYGFTFKHKNGSVMADVPVNPGEYQVMVSIPADNDSFVSSIAATYTDLTITNGIATVKAVPTSSYYSETSVNDLLYQVEGIDSDVWESIKNDGTKIKGSLKLNVAQLTSAYAKLPIGKYAIIENVPFEIQYFDVTFEGNYHEVLQKVVEISILNGGKIYGDPDTAYQFSFEIAQLSSLAAANALFGFDAKSDDGVTAIYESLTFISRESGENAGNYDFIVSTNNFILADDNYAVVVKDAGKYTISKRAVTLYVGEPYSFFATEAAAESGIANIHPAYTLGENEAYASEIGDGKLAIGEQISSFTPISSDKYQSEAKYAITLGTIENTANLTFVIEAEAKYTIYIAKENAVIITPKETTRYEVVYGNDFDPTNIIYEQGLFDVSGAEYGVDFTSISWTATISYGTQERPNVGAYEVMLTNITLKKGNEDVIQIDGHAVSPVCAQFNLYVVPALIVVEPIANYETKTYAESDSLYEIGFEIVSINGIGKDPGAYAGSMFSYIHDNYVSGSFARAIYDKDGNFLAFGSKNDTVTDNNGVVYGSDNFYSYAVLNQFVSKEAHGNYVVEARINKENRLSISKARIEVSQTEFDGVDKVYDGTAAVKYLTTKACDLNGKLAVATDDVEISFVALYESLNGAGDNSSVGYKSIVFTSLGLSGAQACNYDLYINGEKVDADTTFSIFKKLNGKDISILAGTIDLIRSDFTVSKPYDNLQTLDNNSVSIVNRVDAYNKGTSILYGVKDSMQVLYGVYPDKEVSNNYTVDIELFFPLGEDANESTIAINQADKSIDVSLRTIGGVFGVRVYIQGLGASITKRTLGYESFTEIKAVDRDYNAASDITFSYVLASGAAAAGDEAFEESSDSIIIKGKTKNDETNVGTYDTEFTGYSISSVLFDKRYEVDIISLKNYFTGPRKLTVNINPAKLMPRVEFASKIYDGSTKTEIISGTGVFDRATTETSQLTTLNYAENLLNQLKKFSYTFEDVSFKYANKGVISANVQADENGNVVLHNVMVTGLVVTAESGFESLLDNYTIYGGRYDLTSGEYVEIETVTSGSVIDPYEMFNVAEITKRKLQVKANDIEVPDKVYDGTKEATVSASLTTSDAIDEDKEYLEVKATATYARKQVGNNINVNVVIKSIDVKAQYKDTYSELINNYDVATFKLQVQRNILARPVEFAVSFKDRIYDGNVTIAKNLVKYDLGSMLGDDAKNYSVSTDKGAYYLTKDVEYTEYTPLETSAVFNSALDYYQLSADVYSKAEVTSDNFASKLAEGLYIKEFKAVAKLGTAYNPILYNSKEKYINYELSVKTAVPQVGDYFYAYELEDGTVYYGTSVIKATTATDVFDSSLRYYSGTVVTDENGRDQIKLLTDETANLNADVFGEGYYYIPAYENVVAYYYHMPVAKKYVTKAAYAALDDAAKALVIENAIGSYVYNGQEVYLVKDSYTGGTETMSDEDAVKYIQGTGIINRREVSITSVDTYLSSSFAKTYDGTTKYYGVRGTDYDFTSNSISNDIAGDNIDVQTVSAEFKTTQAGMTQVAFTATGIKTKDGYPEASYNYISAIATSTNKPASIAKRTIYAKLADATIVYGSQLSSVTPEITYFLDADEQMPIEIKAGGWYVEFEDFVSACGFDMSTLEEKYKEQLAANRYNESYEKDVNGSLYRLAGTFTEPSLYVEVRGAKQNVGYVAEKFALKGGSATNFTFAPIYTDTVNETSKLTVVKRTIYVIADATKTYSREFGKDLSADAVKILFLNENGKDGIVSGETSLDVYTGSLKVEFRKVAASEIGSIAAAPAVTAKSLINETTGNNQGLEDGYYYVAYIVVKDFASENYDVKFGQTIFIDASEKFFYQFEGTTFTTEVPQLTIVLPEIKDVTKSADSKEVIYNGTNQAASLVSGLGANDKATIGENETVNVIVDGEGNATAYEGDLIITRTLMQNEIGSSYTITLNLGPVSLKINKASAGLYANKQTVEYDGAKHEVASSAYGVKELGAGVSADNFTVHYYVDGKEIDITKQSLINAGSYIYEVVFESTNNNYLSDTKRAQFVISPARINVTVDRTKLVQEYIEGKVYTINYIIEDVKGIGISKEDTELKFVRKGSPVNITKAGRYEFVIALKADKANEYGNNIVFSNNSGYLDLTVSEIVAYNSSEEEVARIQLKNAGDSILADTFTSRYVYATNAKSEDDLYFASVNQYMSSISKAIGSEARLAVVVKMGLTYGINNQNLQGQDAIITVALPETVDKSLTGYALYTTNASGGLEVLRQGDYTVNGDGTITYTSNYLGSLVIVSLATEGLSPAAVGGIAGGSVAVVLIIAGAVAVTIIKKKKMLKSL